jgi:serine protease inhibitor
LPHISGVFHKAWAEVNEEGGEAAAATAAAARPLAIRRPAPAPVFRAGHPFLFLIATPVPAAFSSWAGLRIQANHTILRSDEYR